MIKKYQKLPAYIKIILMILASVFIAFLLEMVVFHSKKANENVELQVFALDAEDAYVSKQQEEILEPLTQSEKNGIEMLRENARILAELNGTEYVEEKDDTLVEENGEMYRKKVNTIFTIKLREKSYIRKIHLAYKDLDESANYTITVLDGNQTVFQGFDGNMDAKIDASVVTVNKAGDTIIYSFKSLEQPQLSQMKLSIVNLVCINWIRVLFFGAVCFILFLFCGNQAEFEQKPERIFALVSFILGSILILCIGTNQVGFDEYTHSATAYRVSFGSTVETTEAAMRMRGNDLPFFHNYEERKVIEAYEQENNDFTKADLTTKSKFITYQDRSYLPIALFIKLGRALKMPFAWNMMFGKWGNLLCYTLLSYLAVKYARSGKGIIMLLSLLPNALFAGSGFTYDGVVNGFLLLAVVLTTNLMFEDTRKITWIQVMLILGAYVAGSTAKPIYIVMALMLVFFSQKKMQGKLQTFGFRLAVVVVAGLLMYTIFFPPVSASANYELVGNLMYAGDKRNQGTSVIGQLGYIFGNPVKYTILLLSSMFGGLVQYVSGFKPFFNYGYLGDLPGVFTIISEILLVVACIFSPAKEERKTISVKFKILNIIMIFGVSAIIWTSMYVSYTPVGNPTIEGVQARYFMPLFLPFAYCMYQKKWKCKISEASYHKIMLGFAAALNVIAIYTLALKPLNF